MRPTTFRLSLAAAIALLPLAAHSQTAPAANLQARLVQPTMPAPVDSTPAPVKSEVRIIDRSFADDAMNSGGTLSFTLVGGSTDTATDPVLTHVVGLGVDAGQMTSNEEEIAIRMTVDRNGVPSNLRLARATNTDIDRKALEAVSQYRFKPATLNHLPTESDVTVQVKLEKR